MFALRFLRKPRFLLPIRASFSETPKDPKNPTDEASDKSKFEDFTDSFFEVLKNATKSTQTQKIFSSRTIYHNKLDPKIFISNNRTRLAIGSLWLVIGYASFAYIHPIVTLIPAWFASGSFLGFFMGNSYSKKLVWQIDISQDQKGLGIKVVNGKEIKVKIEDMDLFDIVELKERNPKGKEKEPKAVSNNFVAVFDVKDEKGKEMTGMRLFIEPQHIKVENMDLFKHILLGNQEEVDKFQFVEPEQRAKEQEKDAKEIDKKIEEEFERIKKEAEEKKEK